MILKYKINLITAGLSIFLLAFLITTEVSSQTPRVKEGVIDLRSWDWEANPDIALKGDWEFYWQKILFSKDTPEVDTRDKDYISLPSPWNNHKVSGKKLGPYGFATYRIKILISDTVNSLAIRTRIISTAYNLYVNGERILHAGKPGKTRGEAIPEYHPNVASFAAASEIEIILQVSNYDHRVGGSRDIILLGKESRLFKSRGLELLIVLFLAGCFFIMGLYHVVLYAINRDRSPLFFSLFCICFYL